MHRLTKMNMRFPGSLLSTLLIAVPSFAQSGSVATPIVGYAFDTTASTIRPIQGVPGAALLGDPFDTGFPIAMAAISPRQNFALAVAADGSGLRAVPLGAGVDAGALPETSLPTPDLIRFSSSGSAALLFQTPGRLQALSGLPAHGTVREIDLSMLSALPTATAVSDDGELVVIAGSGAVWVVNTKGVFAQLALPGSTAALAFRAGSHDLMAVSMDGEVHLVRRPGTNPEYRLIYAAGEQTAAPIGAQFSAGGSHAYVANESGNITAIDMETGAMNSISCHCHASSLDPLNSRNLFRLTSPGQTAAGKSVLMLFDGSSSDARVWFVPPGDNSREAEGRVQ